MARRMPAPTEAAKQTTKETPQEVPEKAKLPEAATEIPEPGKAQPGRPQEPMPEVPVQHYRVTNDPRPGMAGFPILYNGVRTLLPKGKLVSSNTYDVDYLKRQGVTLELIED